MAFIVTSITAQSLATFFHPPLPTSVRKEKSGVGGEKMLRATVHNRPESDKRIPRQLRDKGAR